MSICPQIACSYNRSLFDGSNWLQFPEVSFNTDTGCKGNCSGCSCNEYYVRTCAYIKTLIQSLENGKPFMHENLVKITSVQITNNTGNCKFDAKYIA